MPANFAAVDSLTEFLRTTPDASAAFERIGIALAGAGEDGLPISELMALSGLGRPQFLNAYVDGTKFGLFEKAENGNIRLTEQGQAIY